MDVGFVVSIGSNDAPLRAAVGAIALEGLTITARVVSTVQDAVAAAAELGARCPRVVAVGGDGTVNAVARGLCDSGSTASMGVIPGGTANDFAAMLGVKQLALADAARLAATGHATPIDVGRVNGRLFVNVLTIGFPAELSGQTPRPLKDALGGLAYPLHGLTRLSRWQPWPVEVRGPGLEFVGDALAVCVCNGRQAGGGLQLAPQARLDDGLLDILVVPDAPAGQMIAQLIDGLLFGAPAADGVVTARVAEVSVRSEAPLPVSFDGEVDQLDAIDVTVDPGALRIARPAESP